MHSTGRESFVKAYRLALQLLLMTALPIAVFFTFAATPLIRILGGAAYLPDSATALRIMIWSIPIGFMNSVTQYVLIAVKSAAFPHARIRDRGGVDRAQQHACSCRATAPSPPRRC